MNVLKLGEHLKENVPQVLEFVVISGKYLVKINSTLFLKFSHFGVSKIFPSVSGFFYQFKRD